MPLFTRAKVRELRTKGLEFQNAKAVRRLSWVHSNINDRAGTPDHIKACTEDGMVAFISSGMDCDCTQFYYVTHGPAPTPAAWYKTWCDAQDEAEGPLSFYIGKPSEYPVGRRSSDRALEAYEDGHPSYVTWTDLSTAY